jgi:hypothetical protein
MHDIESSKQANAAMMISLEVSQSADSCNPVVMQQNATG